MDLEEAIKMSLEVIKKLWDQGDRMVSVKRIKNILNLKESHKYNYSLGHALKYLSINKKLLKLHAQRPNRYKILKDPRKENKIKKIDDIE